MASGNWHVNHDGFLSMLAKRFNYEAELVVAVVYLYKNQTDSLAGGGCGISTALLILGFHRSDVDSESAAQ